MTTSVPRKIRLFQLGFVGIAGLLALLLWSRRIEHSTLMLVHSLSMFCIQA
jgi:hypothetical protein